MKKRIIIVSVILGVCMARAAHAAITSVTLTPATPTTLSNGKSYYLAGVLYSFRIQASDPAATGKPYWQSSAAPPPHTISVTFQGGNSFYIDLPGDTNGGTGIVVDSFNDNSGVYTSIDYTVRVRFLWTCASTAFNANSVVATVTANNGATSNSNTRNFNYGIINQIQALNIAQSGDAADGRVNPWHSAFTVTGRVVYYSPGESISNDVPVGADGIASAGLWRAKTAPVPAAAANTGLANGAVLPAVQYSVGASYFSGLGGSPACLGDYTWDVRAVMTLAGAPVTSSNNLTLNCDEIQVTGFSFTGGGGITAPPATTYNLRSVNVPGTYVQLSASLRGSGGSMAGNTVFTISDGANTYALQINNGQSVGSVTVNPYPTVAAGSTLAVGYTITAVSGSAYENGQNSPARIGNSSGFTCYWNNADPPGQNAPSFTAQSPPLTSATTIQLQWTTLTPGPLPYPDAGFYSYRIYYKKTTDTSYTMLDNNTPVASCPSSCSNLGIIGTGSFTIGGTGFELQPLTAYDYQISAIDVFGNEVAPANRIIGQATTKAITVEAAITDGIATFNHGDFANSDPRARSVRQTAIKVSFYVVTPLSGPPDQVNIIVADNDSDLPGAPQYGVAGTNNDIMTLAEGVSRWTVPCAKVGPNTYEGYISTQVPVLALNKNVRFIAELWKNGVPTWSDHTQNANNAVSDEWRFQVGQPAIFIPWPTRILNNVMTSRMPCCFPAYFLTVDSLVTIKVFDIKGRPIATLADRMYRPGGQNIKENGWCGYNKSNARVGPGLYYIQIKAITFGGRTVLDKVMKVVVAH